MTTPNTAFPPGFLWGAATSAYQIEGSPLADGAGVSNWHRFSHTPGRVRDGDTGDTACDHYRRMPEDVALMRQLGLQAYRFSVAWSRVMPDGRGRINPAGLGFYERLVDELLAAGIQPLPTLHHWDWPAALDDRGGWLNPDSAGWFADYAQVMARALGDRVASWATFNEPWVITDGGYLHGTLAPGHRSAYEAAIAARHLMVAHGTGVQALRAEGCRQVGLVVNLEPKTAASDSPADAAACVRAEAYMNRQFLDPAQPHRRGGRRHSRRDGCARLHGLVAAGQPGVGARFLQALRHRARQPGHRPAQPQSQRALVCRDHCAAWGGFVTLLRLRADSSWVGARLARPSGDRTPQVKEAPSAGGRMVGDTEGVGCPVASSASR